MINNTVPALCLLFAKGSEVGLSLFDTDKLLSEFQGHC